MNSSAQIIDLPNSYRQWEPLVAQAVKSALEKGSGGGDGTNMEARVAVLEQIAKDTSSALDRIEKRLDRIDARFDRSDERHDRDFRLTFGAIIAVALGLAGLMARGFHWL